MLEDVVVVVVVVVACWGLFVYLGCVLFTVWRLFVAQWVFVSPSLSGFDRGGISTWSFVSLDMGAFQMCC